jgi:RepB DNA-primase N-terminal domain
MTTPDPATEAERFLHWLDPNATLFTFQTFDDSERGNDSLVRILHGSLRQHFGMLKKLNDAGAGVFVVVNETDGKGRKTENITRVRVNFVDLDGSPLEPVLDDRPNMVVESSPARWHCYWHTSMPLDQFEGRQRALAQKFAGDNVIDLPRVMRLPGFVHRKGKPFVTRIVSINEEPSVPDIVVATQPKLQSVKPFSNR